MSSNTAATTSSHRIRRESLPGCALLNSDVYIGKHSRWNSTTAVAETSNHLTIEVSFSLKHPPLLSKLFVYCPGVNFRENPKILAAVEDLLLLRVAVSGRRGPGCIRFEDCDYLIYRAGADPKPPSLKLIPNPKPNFFRDGVVGILPRSGNCYTIAALLLTSDAYKLRLFDSEVGSWASKLVSLDTPRKGFPSSTRRLNHHITTTVITVGGAAGTMGWVDLWSGILLYDLLREDQAKPTIRHIPLPLPVDIITSSDGTGTKLNCPDTRRGICALFKSGKACLKLADLKIMSERLPYTDIETGWPRFIVDNWAITLWSSSKSAGSYDDWHEEFTVLASEIKMSNTVRSQLQESGLLHCKPSQDGEEAVVELALQNLLVSEPNPSLNGEEDVVYLMARTKFMHPKAWVLAVDMPTSTLLGLAEFGTESQTHEGFSYRPCTISKHMNPSTTPVTRAA